MRRTGGRIGSKITDNWRLMKDGLVKDKIRNISSNFVFIQGFIASSEGKEIGNSQGEL